MEEAYYLKAHHDVIEEFGSSIEGLSPQAAAHRILKYGHNELPQPATKSIAATFLEQFLSPLIYLLLGAVFLLYLRGERADAGIVFAVLVLNALIGTFQEGRAKQALASLKKFSVTMATVFRGNKESIVHDREVVPGDIIHIREGERIPADARIIHAVNLTIDEAILTGEAEPVHKNGEALEEGEGPLPVFAQRNMLFKGTAVVTGSASAIVTATGSATELGHISSEISSVQSEMPLKKHLEKLSRQIIALVAIVCVFLIGYGLMRGMELGELVATAISLAVSLVPEGLPIVVTVILASGVAQMAKRNVLVKKLQAVEALGQAHIIAVDKTGTITRNELAVTRIWTGGHSYQVEAKGFDLKGSIIPDEKPGKGLGSATHLEWLAQAAALCSSASLIKQKGVSGWTVQGEPTEAALTVFAHKAGVEKEELEEHFEILEDGGFDYEKKVRKVLCKSGRKYVLFMTGAPEQVISQVHVSDKEHEALHATLHSFALQGLRVVAAAHHISTTRPELEGDHHFSFDGIFGMQDSLQDGVVEAVKLVTGAGIKVVMITGDHPETAKSIARSAGIFHEGDIVLTGMEMDRMSDEELTERAVSVSVFARVTPEHKLRIVQALQKAGLTVAMTGDGVNDAPSLVAADLGISMGKRGTEVAKEASDLVLLDDNFVSIATAVEEGRSIYRSLQRVVTYLFTGAFGQIIVLIAAMMLFLPLPLLPSQIIWLNFVTDTLMVVALASERHKSNLMNSSYVHPHSIMTAKMVKRVVTLAVPMAVGTIVVYWFYVHQDSRLSSSMALTTLAALHWATAWNARSERRSLFEKGAFLSNKLLVLMTAVGIAIQMGALYLPFMQTLLHTVPLGAKDFLVVGLVVVLYIGYEELRKAWVRLRFGSE